MWRRAVLLWTTVPWHGFQAGVWLLPRKGWGRGWCTAPSVMVTAVLVFIFEEEGTDVECWPCRMVGPHSMTFVEWSVLMQVVMSGLSGAPTTRRSGCITWPHNQKWASSENHVLSHTSGFSWNHYAIFTRFIHISFNKSSDAQIACRPSGWTHFSRRMSDVSTYMVERHESDTDARGTLVGALLRTDCFQSRRIGLGPKRNRSWLGQVGCCLRTVPLSRNFLTQPHYHSPWMVSSEESRAFCCLHWTRRMNLRRVSRRRDTCSWQIRLNADTTFCSFVHMIKNESKWKYQLSWQQIRLLWLRPPMSSPRVDCTWTES